MNRLYEDMLYDTSSEEDIDEEDDYENTEDPDADNDLNDIGKSSKSRITDLEDEDERANRVLKAAYFKKGKSTADSTLHSL
jgi:hypothetical protein